MNHRFLLHYQKELLQAYQLLEEFEKLHPIAANRLQVSKDNIADLELSRLFKSFSFSNARLSSALEDEFSFLSDGMLSILHPHLYAPLPAFSIAEFHFDGAKLNSRKTFPKNTLLSSIDEKESTCFFKTIYPVNLFPMVINKIEMLYKPALVPVVPDMEKSCAFLCLQLQHAQGKNVISHLEIGELRFFIDLPLTSAQALYHLIFNHCVGIAIATHKEDTAPIFLPTSHIQRVGFALEEGVLPYHAATPLPYRLFLEFFNYPEKFLFFDLTNLKNVFDQKKIGAKENIEIIFYLNKSDFALQKVVTMDTLKLGCTPIVNLFESETLPIKIDLSEKRYFLEINKKNASFEGEIYQLKEVFVQPEEGEGTLLFPASLEVDSLSAYPNYYFMRKLYSSLVKNSNISTEDFIYFLEPEKFSLFKSNCIIHIKTICSNHALALTALSGHENVKLGFFENKIQTIKEIFLLKKISLPNRRFMEPDVRWKYLSMFNLNYFSFPDDGEGMQALQHLLEVYLPKNSKDALLRSIASISLEKGVSRSPTAGSPFCPAIKINWQVNEALISEGLYIFSVILEKFFSLYFSKNTQVILNVSYLSSQ